jgi:hypothetical protein
MLLLLSTLTACNSSNTDPGDDGNGTEFAYVEQDGLTKSGTRFTLEVTVDNDSDGTPESTDTNWVEIADRLDTYDGKNDVVPYTMVAGFVTDDIFHGLLHPESDGSLSVYSSIYVTSVYWKFNGWIPYPAEGQASVSRTLLDSTSASGNRREVVSWEAERTGTTSYAFGGTTYDAVEIQFTYRIDRYDFTTISHTYSRKGTDIWVPDLGFTVERESKIYNDDLLFGTRTSRLINIEES